VLKEGGKSSQETRLIYTTNRKTDEIDAENLARLARVDPKLLYPLKHRAEHSHTYLALIRAREALVGARALEAAAGQGRRCRIQQR